MLGVVELGLELPLEEVMKDIAVIADGVEVLVKTLVKIPDVDVLRYVLGVTEVLERGELL